MNLTTIEYEKREHLAYVTLNRPDKLNALSLELQAELNEALWEADNNQDVHCVIIRGAGRAFSAGLDLEPRVQQDLEKQEDVERVKADLRNHNFTVYHGDGKNDDVLMSFES